MSNDIGPGTRLLCIEEIPAAHLPFVAPVLIGTIYTCREAAKPSECVKMPCALHGDCDKGGVTLEETGDQIVYVGLHRYLYMYCLGQFRVIGPGETLPAEILAALDVTTHPRHLEPA